MLAKFLGLNSKGPYLCLEKEKENFGVVLTFFVKRVRKSRKFHVAAVQRQLRNVQKRVMHVQSCCLGDINLLLFSSSLCRRRRRCLRSLLVVIKKFCYHGNVTSQFSSPLKTTFRDCRLLLRMARMEMD